LYGIKTYKLKEWRDKMKKVALFWGDERIYYKEEPIICNEDDVNIICEELIINAFKPPKQDGWISLLPGFFRKVECEEKEDITIKNMDHIDYAMMPTFLYLTDFYNTTTHRFNVSKEDMALSWIVAGIEGKKGRISLRLDAGLINSLRNLGKEDMGDYINLKVSAYVLKRYFKTGGILNKAKAEFACIDTPNRMIINDRELFMGAKNLQYSETGNAKLVDYKIYHRLIDTVKAFSKDDNRTVTDIIKEAIVS
jgi:hypothetical protein